MITPGFLGPVEDHIRDAQIAVRAVRFQINQARQHLAYGNCRAALGAIAGAVERYGAVVSFRRAAGLATVDATTKALVLDLAKLKIEIVKRCVK